MYWLAVVLWMLIIFILSTEHFSPEQTTPILPWLFGFPIRKFLHWAEYFVLAVLLMRALTIRTSGLVTKLLSLAIAVIYAVTDEWHQSFVTSRNAQGLDVVIDAVGALCGTWSWRFLWKLHD